MNEQPLITTKVKKQLSVVASGEVGIEPTAYAHSRLNALLITS